MSERFSQFSYQLVKRVLVEKLGFEMVEVPNQYYLFTHQETDTLLVLPILPNQQNLALMNYRTIYTLLDKRGIISTQAFQALLEEASKTGDFYNSQPTAFGGQRNLSANLAR